MKTQQDRRAAGATEGPERVKANPCDRPGSAEELDEEICAIERRLGELADAGGAEALDADVIRYGSEANERAAAAVSAASCAIVYAWAAGSLLNIAKAALPRGGFGRWRDARAADLGVSVRTAQNWMKLADSCHDVRALLVPGAGLTCAYRAAGVLPAPEATTTDGEGDGDGGDTVPAPETSSPAERAFTALAKGRKLLRHLLESDTVLSADERDRLEEEKASYNTLFDDLLA